MEKFTEKQVEKYIKWTDKNVLSKEEFLGRCTICGDFLDELELPEGAERKVVCLKDRDYFIESYKEVVDFGGFEN